jgi:hypothetical protein
MRKLLRELADTIRWHEPWSFEEDDEIVILDARKDNLPTSVGPGSIIAL